MKAVESPLQMAPDEVVCSASEQGEPELRCAVPGDAQLSPMGHLSKVSHRCQQSRDWAEDGKCCFYSREVQRHLWASATEL